MLSQTGYFLKMPDEGKKPRQRVCPLKWIKRIGVLGSLFFLIKGLLWLLLPGLIAYFSLT
jgi:hypothetical protein